MHDNEIKLLMKAAVGSASYGRSPVLAASLVFRVIESNDENFHPVFIGRSAAVRGKPIQDGTLCLDLNALGFL